MVRPELDNPGLETQCSSHWAIELKSYCWGGVEFIQLLYCIIIYLSFPNCDCLLIREVLWFSWTQELLVPVEKFTVRMPMVRPELATPRLQTQCSGHLAIHFKMFCWEGVEFIQSVYCIIMYLSFLNCDWLLIREVQWFYRTQELLVPVARVELATTGLQTQCSSNCAIQLRSYCWEGVEFIQFLYCIIIYLSFLNCDWLLIWEIQWFYWTQEFLVPVAKFTVKMRLWCSNSQPLDYKLSALAIELYSSKWFCWEGVEFIQLVHCIIIYLSFLNCDWLLIREVQWFYWTQELLVPAEKFTVRMPMVRPELETPGLETQCSSHWAIQLKSYCWEGVEFIQLLYCIIIYLSFPNCDCLLIREVLWFSWTQELLVTVEKFTVRMPMVRAELATHGLQTQCSCHLAMHFKMVLLGRSWVYPVGVLHHYIFIISQLWLTSHPRSTVVLLDTGTPGTSREIYSEDADGETRTRNPWIRNPVL